MLTPNMYLFFPYLYCVKSYSLKKVIDWSEKTAKNRVFLTPPNYLIGGCNFWWRMYFNNSPVELGFYLEKSIRGWNLAQKSLKVSRVTKINLHSVGMGFCPFWTLFWRRHFLVKISVNKIFKKCSKGSFDYLFWKIMKSRWWNWGHL